jgi:hypothetical protein
MSQADSMLNSVVRYLSQVDSEIGAMNEAYMGKQPKDRRPFERPLNAADSHYSASLRSTETFNVEDVVMITLDKDKVTAGGNDATKAAIIVKGEAVLNIGEAFDWTPRGHQDRYDTWLSDESTLEANERALPLFVVYAAQSDIGGYVPDRGQRNAFNNRSYTVNNERFIAKSRGLHKELKALKGQTVPMEIMGNVVYSLHTLPSGRQIAIAFVPCNQRLVGVGEKTYTDSRGRIRKSASGPMVQIANIGGIDTGTSKSA